MSDRITQACLASLIAAAFLVPSLAEAQAPRAPAGWEIPRTAYGNPDLQGNWSNAKIFLGSSGTGAPYEADLVQARQNEGRC